MAVSNPTALITEFSNEFQAKNGAVPVITHRMTQAGSLHLAARITPPANEAWIYVFSTAANSQVPAGPNRALRVGRTASSGRVSQHYGAGGKTANALVQQLSSQYFHWAYLGLSQTANSLNAAVAASGWRSTWGAWVKNTLDRDLFVVPVGNSQALAELEKFIRGRLGPVFESPRVF